MSHYGFGFGIGQVKKASAVSYDADAQAFFTATGITDTTQKSAVNQLVLNLKSYNIWTKMKAVWPMVGGSSTTHKYNLVNPADSNAAFRLSFSTGWTHSSTGATPNGSSAYVNTFLNPNAQSFGQNEGSYGFYSRTSRSGNDGYQQGIYESGKYTLLIPYGTTGNVINFHNSTTATAIAATGSTGFWQMSRTSSTNTFHSRNTSQYTVSLTSTGVPNGNFYFGARNNLVGGFADAFDSLQLAFAYIAKDGLTLAEMDNYNTAVTTFQTTLSRNV